MYADSPGLVGERLHHRPHRRVAVVLRKEVPRAPAHGRRVAQAVVGTRVLGIAGGQRRRCRREGRRRRRGGSAFGRRGVPGAPPPGRLA